MADVKITALPAAAGVTADDLLAIVNDPLGTPATQKATALQLLGYVQANAQIAEGQVTGLSADLTARLLISNYDWSTLPNKPALGSLALLSTITASLISDATANGRSLIQATDYTAMRALLFGAATSITGGGTLALGGFTLTIPATGTAALLGTANVFTAAQTITSASASALAVGPSGATNPILQVVANVASAITGLSITGNASGAGVTLTALGGTNESITLVSKGTGRVLINTVGGFSLAMSGTNRAAIGTGYFQVAQAYGFLWSTDPLITVGDTGFFRNAAAVVEVTNGTAGQWGALKAGTRDAVTNTVTVGLTLGHQSTGTPAAGLGMGALFNLNSSTTADQSAAQISALWADATHATRKARLTLNVFDTASREGLRIEADGTNPMVGFLGANASARTAITGSRGANAALANLLTELATKGLIVDSTTV